MRVRVKHVNGAYRVKLPTYRMIPGSFLPLIPGVVHRDGVEPPNDTPPGWNGNPNDPRLSGLSVLVDVPDEYEIQRGFAHMKERIRSIYKGNPDWDNDDELDI